MVRKKIGSSQIWVMLCPRGFSVVRLSRKPEQLEGFGYLYISPSVSNLVPRAASSVLLDKSFPCFTIKLICFQQELRVCMLSACRNTCRQHQEISTWGLPGCAECILPHCTVPAWMFLGLLPCGSTTQCSSSKGGAQRNIRDKIKKH